jgi:hypothetical protein
LEGTFCFVGVLEGVAGSGAASASAASCWELLEGSSKDVAADEGEGMKVLPESDELESMIERRSAGSSSLAAANVSAILVEFA